MCSSFPSRVACESCGKLSAIRFDPYDELLFHDCEADLWGAIELGTGKVRGDLDPEVVRASSRAVFAEAEWRMDERLASS